MKRAHKWLLIAAVTAIAAGVAAAAARADWSFITFESYTEGSIHNQDGWSSSGAYDHKVASTAAFPGAPSSFGTRSLRISNAVTSGSFGDHTFSKPLVNEAGEPSALNAGQSGGTRQSLFGAAWSFWSTVPGAEQPGLSVVASPDRGDGARMSWVQMADASAGLAVNFFEYKDRAPFGTTATPAAGCGAEDDFVMHNVASGLSRTAKHTVAIGMRFAPGPRNDSVYVFVDGRLRKVGTSWEDYFRWCEGPGGPFQNAPSNDSRTVDSILFRTGGAAAPGTDGKGFLIDNLALASGSWPTGEDD